MGVAKKPSLKKFPVSVGGSSKFDASKSHATGSDLQRKPIAAGGEKAIHKRLFGTVATKNGAFTQTTPEAATAASGSKKIGKYPKGAKDYAGHEV